MVPSLKRVKSLLDEDSSALLLDSAMRQIFRSLDNLVTIFYRIALVTNQKSLESLKAKEAGSLEFVKAILDDKRDLRNTFVNMHELTGIREEKEEDDEPVDCMSGFFNNDYDGYGVEEPIVPENSDSQ
jgi:hypothetical protein